MTDTDVELLRLSEDRQRLRNQVCRCDDLGMKMLLTGKLKANHRAADELRARASETLTEDEGR